MSGNYLPTGRYPFSRRRFIKTAMGSFATLSPMAQLAFSDISLAANPTGVQLHGLSSFGNLKYPPGYSSFDYAALDAPKGGTLSYAPSFWYFNQNPQTFNTLNSFVLKGEAPPGLENCFDTLMVWAIDEPDSLYCSLARSVEISADRNSYRFTLRKEARFHDGSPVTAKDVAFSLKTLKKSGHPQLAIDLTDLSDVVAISPHLVELQFNGSQSDRAILSIAQSVPILSAGYYKNLAFEDHVMETPLGSGPCKVGKFSAGTFIEYDRVADYWAAHLPFARGLNHFDHVRIDFFRERQAAFEAFKKGVVRWREEATSKIWATEYDFPAVKSGAVKKIEIPGENRPALQGWAVNARKAKFADLRTREAIGLAFDFNWTNKNLFYGAYQRSHSIFEQSEFAARELPNNDELALLEPLRDMLPDTAFGEPVRQFESNGSGRDRRALRKARKLLLDGGFTQDGSKLVDANGHPLEIEFLIRSQVFERILGPYIENLRTLGIHSTIRLADPSQFQARIESFDFDLVGLAFSFEPTPTAEGMKQFFHSKYANQNGSNNYPGIALEPVDRLIEHIEQIKTRKELETALKALDRVLRAFHFWIPNWYSPNHRIAMWDMFGWKEPKPEYFFPVEQLWWVDPLKEAALKN